MNMDQLREFVKLEWEEAELEDRLNAIKKRLSTLEASLTPQFAADQIKSIQVDGRAIALKRDIRAWSVEEERENVIAALRESDLGQYVKENYNSQSLNKWVREIAQEAEDECTRAGRLFTEVEVKRAMPPALAQVLKVAFVFKLSSRKVQSKSG